MFKLQKVIVIRKHKAPFINATDKSGKNYNNKSWHDVNKIH